MRRAEFIDLCSDDEAGDSNAKDGTKELNSNMGTSEESRHPRTMREVTIQESEGNSSTRHGSMVDDSRGSLVDKSNVAYTASVYSAPICRQFWKAGNYEARQGQGLKAANQNGHNHLHVHPMFLHSNATSHKWAFGAIAELLDNAVDEIQNGATFVTINKISNPRDGSPTLLIQDDGGGMDPEALKRCMSFGFSDKNSELTIGQYGNGFKTSSMRLGADVILFSRHWKSRSLTQSVGLLSYTFLSLMGYNKIVVPMVHYELNLSTRTFEPMHDHGKEYFQTNLSMLLQWSPYSTEDELLKQFDDIGHHGTKVVIYNLWLNDDGDTELDFDSDAEDIRINCDPDHQMKPISKQHIANQYQYSLRVYSSILYLQLPRCFKIILRGRVVDPQSIASDLKYPEVIVYRPQSAGHMEAVAITTIGFLKEAPRVATHGFNIYHRNRLILPFWPAVKNRTHSAGRGVVGVLEANFIVPTHSKQDFEKTSLFQKLEDRLKQMTAEYWDIHCELIGYRQEKKKHAATSLPSKGSLHSNNCCVEQFISSNYASPVTDSSREPSSVSGFFQNIVLSNASAQGLGEPTNIFQVKSQQGLKRKQRCTPQDLEDAWHVGSEACAPGTLRSWKEQLGYGIEDQLQDQEIVNLLKVNKRLQSQLLELEKSEEHLTNKAQLLRSELEAAQSEYKKLLAELEMVNK